MTTRKKESFLIFLCWIAYTASYLGRYSYNANINLLMSDYGASHGQAGLVTTMFFFAYGVGQIVNGILCRFYPKRAVIAGALCVSSVLNLLVFLDVPFGAIRFLWLANGAVLSILWSSLVLVLSEHIGKDKLPRAVVVMNTTTAIGNFIAYALAGLFASVGSYRFTFLTAASVMGAVAVLWFFCFPAASAGETLLAGNEKPAERRKHRPEGLLLAVILMLGVFAVADNLIKDGLHTWIPSVLS